MTWLLVLFVATWGLLCLGLLWSGRPLKALVTHLGRMRARLARLRRLHKVPGKPKDGKPISDEERAALEASWRCPAVAEPEYGQQRGRKRQ